MSIESGDYIDDLDPTWPLPGDPVSEGDDHIRLVKHILKTQFPNLTEAMTRTAEELNELSTPPGMIMTFGADASMPGWIFCNGDPVSRTTYDKLFDAIGTTWGIGDGATTFNVPELRVSTIGGAGGGNTIGTKSDIHPATPDDTIQIAWVNFFIKT